MRNQLVWFKRDLRVSDHEPLRLAAERGPVLCLYVYEPEWLQGDDFDGSHLDFINQSLRELRQELMNLGGRLTLRTGPVPKVLHSLHARYSLETIWSHQETGNAISFQRDRQVKQWCRENGVRWVECHQFGVVRGLANRDGWARKWEQRMQRLPVEAPDRVEPLQRTGNGALRSARDLGIEPSCRKQTQQGGQAAAQRVLQSFLTDRGRTYQSDMSSPLSASDACSRLSPYLAWGNISMKQVVHAVQSRVAEIRETRQRGDRVAGGWARSLSSFQARLRWHCHFMQKLEDEPELEFRNLNRGFDGLRETEFDDVKYAAWCQGMTGFPMVDACMRALHQTGWINFRMRAMLVSFASYHLWLHWRKPALYLARLFLDYEPGIHYSQVQMQAGVTGINTIRIYSPSKQVQDQDPKGLFLRTYLPELADVPDHHLAEPHRMTQLEQQLYGCRIDVDYPAPIVNHADAYREARDRIHAARATPMVKEYAEQVYQKHGSRKRPLGSRKGRTN